MIGDGPAAGSHAIAAEKARDFVQLYAAPHAMIMADRVTDLRIRMPAQRRRARAILGEKEGQNPAMRFDVRRLDLISVTAYELTQSGKEIGIGVIVGPCGQGDNRQNVMLAQ